MRKSRAAVKKVQGLRSRCGPQARWKVNIFTMGFSGARKFFIGTDAVFYISTLEGMCVVHAVSVAYTTTPFVHRQKMPFTLM